MNVLVVAAHPDDETLGCGGTMARLAKEGTDVALLVLGEGVTSRFDGDLAADAKAPSYIGEHCRAAAAILGVKEVEHLSLPDNRFDTVPLLEVVKLLESAVRRYEPAVVYTQHGGDLNIDHVITFRASLTALRPQKGRSVREVYAYEVASSTDWSFAQFSPSFRAQRFVDISDTLETKIRAMETYTSEAREFPHPRSPEALRATARRWGSQVGFEAAEAFSVLWQAE